MGTFEEHTRSLFSCLGSTCSLFSGGNFLYLVSSWGNSSFLLYGPLLAFGFSAVDSIFKIFSISTDDLKMASV